MTENEVEGFCAWFSSRILKQPQLLEEIISKAKTSACNVLEPQVAELMGYATGIMCAVLTELHCENAAEVLATFVYWLENKLNTQPGSDYAEDLISWIEQQEFKELSDFAIAERHNPCVLLTERNVCLTTAAMQEAAEVLEVPSDLLAARLLDDGILDTSDKRQRVFRCKDGTARLYGLKLDKLYAFGEIRPSVKSQEPPYLTVKIGECGGKEVHFSLFGAENSQNPHTYICGPSASGKSYFLNKLAHNASMQGIQVVSVGLYGSALELDDSDIINIEAENLGIPDILTMSNFAEAALHQGPWTASEKKCLYMMMDEDEMKGTAEDLISEIRGCSNETFKDTLTQKLNALVTQGTFNSEPDWDEILHGAPVTVIAADGDTDTLEAIFKSLYDWKQKGDKSPLLLIIDECQTCDLSQNGTISKLIMRQGRKFGVMCFLASQYLSAEDARNISHTLSQCDTTFAFAPGNNADVIKRLGVSTDDKQNRSNIQNVPKYHCVAKGKLSCNGAEVSYPVIIKA